MLRTFIQTKLFSKIFDEMIAKGKLSRRDFEDLEKSLLKNPKLGTAIPGMSGIRKIRLKGLNSGKSGSFRIDYLDIPDVYKLYFIVLYKKNIKGDLSPEEKRDLRDLAEMLKEEERKNG